MAAAVAGATSLGFELQVEPARPRQLAARHRPDEQQNEQGDEAPTACNPKRLTLSNAATSDPPHLHPGDL